MFHIHLVESKENRLLYFSIQLNSMNSGQENEKKKKSDYDFAFE